MANLIIYYSRRGENYFGGQLKKIERGNSELCAEYIKNAVGGELFEIETVKPYSEDYMTCTEEAKAEKNSGARPDLTHYLSGLDGYDNVFIVGPCWWGTFPCAMFTQLEKLDFSGKNVFPLMTHEGSGLGSSERDLKKICTGANFGRGLAVHGSQAAGSEDTVAAWAKKCVK